MSLTKQKISQFDAIQINSRRSATMLAKYGVEFNSQRLEIKKILQNPKIPIEAYLKLTNCKLGLLINFNVSLIKNGVKRVVANYLNEVLN